MTIALLPARSSSYAIAVMSKRVSTVSRYAGSHREIALDHVEKAAQALIVEIGGGHWVPRWCTKLHITHNRALHPQHRIATAHMHHRPHRQEPPMTDRLGYRSSIGIVIPSRPIHRPARDRRHAAAGVTNHIGRIQIGDLPLTKTPSSSGGGGDRARSLRRVDRVMTVPPAHLIMAIVDPTF